MVFIASTSVQGYPYQPQESTDTHLGYWHIGGFNNDETAIIPIIKDYSKEPKEPAGPGKTTGLS